VSELWNRLLLPTVERRPGDIDVLNMKNYREYWRREEINEYRWLHLLDEVMAVTVNTNRHRERYHVRPTVKQLLEKKKYHVRPDDVEGFT
jgi:hypothetical protein